jgi:hypothetical protein
MHIRQVALVARDLDRVVDDLCAVFDIAVSFNDPGVGVFGLRNAVLPVGETFLEVVSPITPDASAARFLERRKGDGGYMVILQTDDLAADRARLGALGVRIVWETTLDDIATIHLHPRDLGGAIVSIDQPQPPPAWRWAGKAWQGHVRTTRVLRVAGVSIETPHPAVLAARWARVLGTDWHREGGERGVVALRRGAVRMIPEHDDRGEGISAIVIETSNADAVRHSAEQRGCLTTNDDVEIGGVRFLLR